MKARGCAPPDTISDKKRRRSKGEVRASTGRWCHSARVGGVNDSGNVNGWEVGERTERGKREVRPRDV